MNQISGNMAQGINLFSLIGKLRIFPEGRFCLDDDDCLKIATRVFVLDIIDFIKERKSEEPDPFRIFTNNLIRILPTEKEKWVYVRKDRWPVNHLPSLIPFIQALENHECIGKQINTKLGTSMGVSDVNAWNVIDRIMQSLLNLQSGIEFEERAFETVFEQMIAFFKSESVIEQILIPLENFVYSGKEIDLPSNWKIIQLPTDIREHWDFILSFPHLLALSRDHFRVRWILIKEYERTKEVFPQGAVVDLDETQRILLENEININISAMRLLKRGCVTYRFIDTRIMGWYIGGSDFPTWNSHISLPHGLPYRMNDYDIEPLREIINDLPYSEGKDSFQVALRRLNQIVERGGSSRDDDIILDAIIALESVLLGKTKGELRYRLSLRATFLLGYSAEARNIINRTMKYLYNLRSAIVHGYNQSGINKALKELQKIHHQEFPEMGLSESAEIAEHFLRRCLRTILKVIKNHSGIQDIMTEIDKAIIRRGVQDAAEKATDDRVI